MSMVDSEALPPEPPPMADPGGVPMPAQPPAWNPSVDLSVISRSGQPSGAVQPGAYAAPVQQQPATGASLEELSQQAAGFKRQEMADKARITAEEDARLAKHRATMDARFAQTGVNPEDFKPWDQNAARETYRHDPIQEFGSLGSVFAIVASAFTNRPMEAALFGSAAAIEAAKAGKTLEYNRAYKTWQDNTALAAKRQSAMHQSYADATSMVSTDMALAQQRLQAVATQYGDKQMLAYAEAGLWPKAMELLETRDKLNNGIIENAPKLATALLKQSQLLQIQNLPPEQRPAAIREMQNVWSAGKDSVIEDIIRKEQNQKGSPLTSDETIAVVKKYEDARDSGGGTRKMSAAEQSFSDDFEAKNGTKPGPNDWIDFKQRERATASKDTEFIKRRTTEIMVEQSGQGKDVSETQAEKMAREELTRTRTNPAVTERLGSIEKAKAKYLEEHPEANGVIPTEVENQIRANAHRSVTNATLDDRTARLIAEQVIAGRYQAMSGLGHGGIGTANRAKVLGLMTEIADAKGLNGADIARQAIEYQATGRGASSLAQLEARTTGAITKAQATAPRVLEISDQIDRTRYPKINDIIIAAQRNVGGEKVVKLGVAVETFINNYAMALGGGSSVMTDSSKQHARALLELGYSKGQMHAAVDQMMIEMESELAGIKRGLSTYLEPPKKDGSMPFRPPANAGWHYNETLDQYRDPQGVIYDKNGKKIR